MMHDAENTMLSFNQGASLEKSLYNCLLSTALESEYLLLNRSISVVKFVNQTIKECLWIAICCCLPVLKQN